MSYGREALARLNVARNMIVKVKEGLTKKKRKGPTEHGTTLAMLTATGLFAGSQMLASMITSQDKEAECRQLNSYICCFEYSSGETFTPCLAK